MNLHESVECLSRVFLSLFLLAPSVVRVLYAAEREREQGMMRPVASTIGFARLFK